MKKFLVLLIAATLIVPTLIKADEKLWGMTDYPLDKEITETTDLIQYMLAKSNTARDEAHTSRETIDNLIKRSCSGIIAPHFVQCWEDPYYFPRFVKRVTNDLSRNWKDERTDLGMYNIFVSSEVRTGYLAGGFPDYIPKMEVDPDKPLEKALEKIYKDAKWEPVLSTGTKTAEITIGSNTMLVDGQQKPIKPPAQIIVGNTMVGLRTIADILHATVEYDSPTKKIILKWDNNKAEMTVGKNILIFNGWPTTLDSPTIIKDGYTLVPLRAMSYLGFELNFNSATKTINATLIVKDYVGKKNLEAVKDIPIAAQKVIADYLLSQYNAGKYADIALRKLPKNRREDLWNIGRYHFLSDRDYGNKAFMDKLNKLMPFDSAQLEFDMAHDIDYNSFYWGALPLVMSTKNLKSFIKDPKEEDKKDGSGNTVQGKPIDLSKMAFELDLPYGKFAFNGKATDDKYDCDKYYSVVDLAGNDTYTGASASTTLNRPVGTIIDWAGNDTYSSTADDACSQGFGMMGYGILVDHAGNDKYTSYDNSQGSCFFGVGLLWDENGDDSFEGRNMNQGAASYGVGNLVNVGGNDRYYCFQVGQAFGFCGGCGILIDTEGDDIYIGEPGKDNPEKNLINPATGGHDNNRNYSFVQGAGWGRRADMTDGLGMGGGSGILVDVAGNDQYICGVYGQATGYWFGTGILSDLTGDDRYEGSFFVQSGTAHMGLTEVLDEEGNDTYKVWKAISQAGAHDFSVSWFIDKKGNDNYLCYEVEDEKGPDGKLTGNKIKTSGGVLVGSSITNSIAVHIDYAGDDNYELVNSSTLGYCLLRTGPVPDSYRYEEYSVGLMINRGGNDTYNRVPEASVPEGWPVPTNNAMWKEVTQPGNLKKSVGFGLDIDKGIVPEAEW